MNLPNAGMKTVMSAVIAVAVICTAGLVFNSVRLSQKIDRVRLENEIIISEKIELTKMLEGLKRDTSLAYEKNRELTRMLESIQAVNRTADKK